MAERSDLKNGRPRPAPPGPYVLLGRLGRPHGLKGEIRLEFFGDNPEILMGLDLFLLPKGGGGYSPPVKATGLRPSGGGLLLLLEGSGGRDQALRYRGHSVYVLRESLPPAGEDEIYQHDLLGMEVRLRDGGVLGVVEGLTDAKSALVLVVKGKGGEETLVPFTDGFILETDMESRTITTLGPDELEAFQSGRPGGG
jgi:16S rRNA processing protein RimM